MRSALLGVALLVTALLGPAAGQAPDGRLPIDPYDAGPPPDAGRPVGAIFEEAARAAARDRNALGLRLTGQGRHPEALAAFREAHALDPSDPEITNNLGFLHLLLGDRADAERHLRETLRLSPRRATALDNLAELLADSSGPDRQAEAADLLARLRLVRGNDPRIIRRQARLAARRGRFDDAQRFYEALLATGPVDDALALELGDFHRGRGDLDAALGWYRRVRAPADELAEAARRIREVEVEREARRYGWVRPDAEPPPAVRARRRSARAALQAGDAEEAIRLLTEVIEQAPGYADAYADLGDARRAAGAATAAEIAYLRALVIDGTHADAARRLGDLYRAAERWADAASLWDRALALRPEWTDLHLPIARAWRSAGDLPRALRRTRLGLAALPEDAPDDRLRRLEAELTRALPAPDPRAPAERDPSDIGEALARARAHLSRGEPDAALAALRGLPPDSRTARVAALEGRIFRAAGRLDEAIAAFTESLSLDPGPAPVRALLGEALLDRGRVGEARRHLQQAADEGEPRAAVRLLALDAARAPGLIEDLQRPAALWALSRRAAALAEAVESPVLADRLTALVDDLTRRLTVALAVYGGALLVLLLAGIALARRRWGGDTLAELVDRFPEAGPDVQRVLSAIRHEVLKHNTLALGGLADALARGEDPVQKAAWVRQSLLGPPDDPQADAADHRLRGYAEQLRQIGRSHGRRLNLERRDRALSALLRGFRILRGAAGDLDRAVVRGRAGRGLRRAVARAAHALNVEGLGALRGLLDQLRAYTVTAAGLRAIFDRTRREPGFAATPVAPLMLDAGPLPARVEVPRFAFEDILTNLLRNAIQAAASHEPGEVIIGLAVEQDEDPITGLCSLRFRVRDRAPQPLTTARLRGRFIEEGLGLTGDLVTRHEGSLEVEPDAAPWTKAVVLTLPRAEDAADTAQRAAISGFDDGPGPDDEEEDRWTR